MYATKSYRVNRHLRPLNNATYPQYLYCVIEHSATHTGYSVVCCVKSLYGLVAGGDGGWNECVWSESLGTCFSPSFLPLICAAGVCGRIIRHSAQACSSACPQYSRCSLCMKNSNCGWCSKQGITGIGICLDGSLEGHCLYDSFELC